MAGEYDGDLGNIASPDAAVERRTLELRKVQQRQDGRVSLIYGIA